MALDPISMPHQQDMTAWENPLWQGTLDTIVPSDQVQKLNSTINELRWNTNMGLTSLGEVPILYSYNHRAHDYRQPSPTYSTLISESASMPTRSLSGTTIAPSTRSPSNATIDPAYMDDRNEFREPQYDVGLPDDLPPQSVNVSTRDVIHQVNDDIRQPQQCRQSNAYSETLCEDLSHRTKFSGSMEEPISPISSSPSSSMAHTLPDDNIETDFVRTRDSSSKTRMKRFSHSRSASKKQRRQKEIELPGIDEGFWHITSSSIWSRVQQEIGRSCLERPNDLMDQMVNCRLSQDERKFVSLVTGSRLRSLSLSHGFHASDHWRYLGRSVIPSGDLMGPTSQALFEVAMEHRTSKHHLEDLHASIFNECCTSEGSELYSRLRDIKKKVDMFDTMNNQNFLGQPIAQSKGIDNSCLHKTGLRALIRSGRSFTFDLRGPDYTSSSSDACSNSSLFVSGANDSTNFTKKKPKKWFPTTSSGKSSFSVKNLFKRDRFEPTQAIGSLILSSLDSSIIVHDAYESKIQEQAGSCRELKDLLDALTLRQSTS